jgi:SAM-dependent methyltransferase
MKKVYRYEDNEEYWDRRWREAESDAGCFSDMTIYPIRYAEAVVASTPGRILEIGCGLARIVKHYHAAGREIIGIERSKVAVDRLSQEGGGVDVRYGDALALPFPDLSFEVVLAFGVYHNFESGIEQGLAEAARVLKPGGRFAISMRPQNIEMSLNEMYWNFKRKPVAGAKRRFHKVLVTEADFTTLLAAQDLHVSRIHHARNLSILFRLPFLQSREARTGHESVRRSKGYRLNAFGRMLDRGLTALFPYQFCNVLVFEGTKGKQ